MNAQTEPGLLYPQCKSCRYRCRNCTQAPCITCEDGSEWEKSNLDERDGWDG